MTPSDEPLTRSRVLRIAWPIILANATVPLLGLVDTAVIGNTGSVFDLGAIALGSLVFSFLYWSFGFLRMGTTGFVAQAAGAQDEGEVRAVLGRALLIAALLGTLLLLFKAPLREAALHLVHGSSEVESVAARYIEVRLYGAPASLLTLALRGTLLGLGYTRALLLLELALNGLNLGLDLLFVGVFRWGAPGVALGTTLAEWLSLLLSLSIVLTRLRARHVDDAPFWSWSRLLLRERLVKLLHANADIMIRTVLLLLGFAWFTDQSARFGDVVLAANHVLLQFISFAAFFLDGYAFAAEALVGAALGAERLAAWDAAVRRSSELALISAIALALLILVYGPPAIAVMTNLDSVRAVARDYLHFAALYVVLAVGAFQLDGIFIGATQTRAMRNGAIASTGLFLLAGFPLTSWAGNVGLWLAFLLFAVARAAALGLHYPALRRSVAAARR